jgi:hypothetical protein
MLKDVTIKRSNGKSLWQLKERLNIRRISIFFEENKEGKLFFQFVALIYLSCYQKVYE